MPKLKNWHLYALLGSVSIMWSCSPAINPPAGTGGAPGTGGTGTGAVGNVGGTGTGAVGNVGGTGTGGGGPTGGAPGTGAAPGTGGGPDGSGGVPATGPATVQLDQVRQLIRGFGINNNWAPFTLEPEGGSVVIDRLFGNGPDSLDLNILRVGMAPTGDPYNPEIYDDIDAVFTAGAEYFIATVWTPPGDMKINADGSPHSEGDTNGNGLWDGGHLDPAFYEDWADVIAAFPGKVATETTTAAEIYAMSPQNEADFASCGRAEPCNGNYDTTVMTGAEAVAFQKVVGPKLRTAGVIPMSPEASEWIHVWSNQSASGSLPSDLDSSDPLDCGFPLGTEGPGNCVAGTPFDDGYEYGHALYSDPTAWAAFDIMGTHQYDTQVGMPWPSSVPQETKEVWQTEMSGVKWWPEQGTLTAGGGAEMGGQIVTPTTHIQNGVAVARWVHSGLVDGSANAWLYWWYRSIDTDDNEGLLTKAGDIAKRFYTFGNFTKYVKPGFHRVELSGAVPAQVLISAYKGDAGELVIVAINETEAAVEVPITIAGGTAPATMTPYVTSDAANWAAGTAVPVTAGVLAAALPAMSVSTFVSP